MTTTDKVDFSSVPWGSVPWTMLCTLYMRAHESRSDHSILADHAAAAAVDRIDYDFERIRKAVRASSSQYSVVLRAKQLDDWSSRFLDGHRDAVVLHLGCGLDSRAFRLDPPAGVDWFDVDVPGVMELRRQVYPEHDGYRMIASSVTEPGWLDAIPTGRPALVVAEGLVPYLTEAQVRQLFQRLTDRFATDGSPGGELLFDGLAPWAVRLSKIQHWGLRDPRQLEHWNPRLTYVEQTSALAQWPKVPHTGYRRILRLCNALPGLRTFNREFRFCF